MSKQLLGISAICVGVGQSGTTSMVARVAIVNYTGHTVFDTFVQPTMPVTDYRTASTGIEPAHLTGKQSMPFATVQQHVANYIKGNVLVGHCIWNDLSVLGIPHPAVDTRDVALYQPFRNTVRTAPTAFAGLQTLLWQLMRRRCQEGCLNPVENSRAAMDLYRTHAGGWEDAVSKGNWPCQLPPSSFSRCYL
ncbi:hypothetical protein CYLTODRAFT_492561 [Cylindrobasidium torrendii FP15055 ss-10]|uniref:RNA exonuclease 4 n=1 Tax=Cylindrobasidium torrendii FP15055 ss-10 TaxID=1314674 RepID=A0A0D7B3Q1_9AGAR|nr:hypothetical protein CYLTODRAFT_492561 [Cylindrobasidium torrendii FP15055 ss-10]